MKLIDHLEASIAGLTMPNDLEHLPPARLRRLRDYCHVVQKVCDHLLAQRVCEPKAGVLVDLKGGRQS